jgi:hypothetical protein
MKRDYCILTSGDGNRWRDFLERDAKVGDQVLDFEARSSPNRPDLLEIRFAIDWPGVDEWLEDKVSRILGGFREATDWSVYRIEGFPDLSFKPLPNGAAKMLYEFCEIRGSRRYAAIGHFLDGYRFYAGPLDPDSDASGFIDVEPSLLVCVIRVAHYIATGEGRSIALPKQLPQSNESEYY